MIVTEYAELVEARRRVARMQAEHVCDEHCAHRALIGEIVRPEVPVTESTQRRIMGRHRRFE